MPQTTIPALFDALLFKHRDQRRKGSVAPPYINHPIAVAHMLANTAGVSDLDVLMAALLHDTIEDTQATAAELEARFGARVTARPHHNRRSTAFGKLLSSVTSSTSAKDQSPIGRPVVHAPPL